MTFLARRLGKIFRDLRGLGVISPETVEAAVRDVRKALLEADVHFRVVQGLVDGVLERARGAEVLDSVTPGDAFVKVVRDEIARVLGAGRPPAPLRRAERPPTVILLVGLQGSGKTTTAAKIAARLGRESGGAHRVGLAACDLRRPAAVEQLRRLADRAGAAFIGPNGRGDPAEAAAAARARAVADGLAALVVDTGGRDSLDDEMMREIEEVRAACRPDETLLVLDAAAGHAALPTSEAFHERLGLTGAVLARSDGDARGGAALALAAGVGVPLRWVGTGEKIEDLDAFDPARMADRILGMGDVVGLVERAERAVDAEGAERLRAAVEEDRIDLEVFLESLRGVRRMGPLNEIVEMLPGVPGLAGLGPGLAESARIEDDRLRRYEAIILSMTPEERRRPDLLDGSRRRRIAAGAGVAPADVNDLVRQFEAGREMMRRMTARAGVGGRSAGRKARRRRWA